MAGEDKSDRPPADPTAVRVVVTRSGLRVRLPAAGDFQSALAAVSLAVGEAGGAHGVAVTVDAAGRTLGVAQLRDLETLFLERHGAALLQVMEGHRGGSRTPRGLSAPSAAPAEAPERRSAAAGAGRRRVAVAARSAPAVSVTDAHEEAAAAAETTSADPPTLAAPAVPDAPVPVLTRVRTSSGSPAAAAPVAAVDITPTLLVRRTLRSGQRVRFNGNVVVVGDVNPGAEIVASGDIVVMGTLRGVAHAGATGSAEAIVAAFRLQPVQLRVGSVIGRAPDGQAPRPDVPEVARVRDGSLVIERFLPQGSD